MNKGVKKCVEVFPRGRFYLPNSGLTEFSKVGHIDASIFLSPPIAPAIIFTPCAARSPTGGGEISPRLRTTALADLADPTDVDAR